MPQEKPQRRWYQFSLRTLLLLVTVASAGFGWLGMKVQKAQRHKQAVEAIQSLGGSFRYQWESEPMGPHRSAWLTKLIGDDYSRILIQVRFDGSPITDNTLVHLHSLVRLDWLNVYGTKVTDVGLENLRAFPKLRVLVLGHTQITDAGLVHLEGLHKLQVLWLNKTQVTDAGLVHLQGLTEIEELELSGTQITDAGLAHFRGLIKLKELRLAGTQVTDAGLKELQQAIYPNLKSLGLADTKVTDAGIQTLRQAMPKLVITQRKEAWQ